MESHFFSSMSQWFMYLLPTIVGFIRLRMGKSIVGSLGFLFVLNLFLGWTILMWILVMANALGYNPVPAIALRVAKFLPSSGMAGPMSVPQQGSFSSHGQSCGQCGGSGSMMCSQCQGRGSWYTQPTRADEVAQLQTCSYCMSSGRIRCSYCGGVRV
ncbi:MAG TPA: hypothetical protein VJR03_06150 [Nitrospira sp.]|nr:hypothetical protein [Nitrospira sp.]